MSFFRTTFGSLTRYFSSFDMSRSKKIFAIIAAVFFLMLMYAVYDISTRTTFPGSDKNKIEEQAIDSVSADTTR